MDYLDIAEQMANHQASAKEHLVAQQALLSADEPDTTLALGHLAEAQRHMVEAERLLQQLRAIDPSLGRLKAADLEDIRRLHDDV